MKRFEPFHGKYPPKLVNWVKARSWKEFSGIQRAAIERLPIDSKNKLPDAIIEAETASGKTEAVFLPLLARIHLSGGKPEHGFSILYISPLKALINDQEQRLGSLAGTVNVDVHPWHSEVEGRKKAKARKEGTGILLTTPESLEGFFVRAQEENPEIDLIARAGAIVIDELHAFIDNARGRHLQSLLHRLDQRALKVAGAGPIPRIGLSATLGDIDALTKQILRPKSKRRIEIIRSADDTAREISIRVKAFLDDQNIGESGVHALLEQYARQFIKDFKKDDRGLIFTNSRSFVEQLQVLASEAARDSDLVFRRHHSSVKASERKELEKQMRGDSPKSPKRMVAICTSTLELGIDIGKVHRVVQIDPTYTVSALRQRVGRSGRRHGIPSMGLIYVGERVLSNDSHPLDRLRLRTFQAIATAQLSVEAKFEEPNLQDLHLSTLYHQIQSVLRELGPQTTEFLHRLLIEQGPWCSNCELGKRDFFGRFLRAMAVGPNPVIESVQETEDADIRWRLYVTEKRRPIAYAVFRTPPEYTVYHGGDEIGNLPMTTTYRIGETFVLRGGRWRVLNVNDENRTIHVARAPSAGAPRYGGTAQAPSGLVASRMRQIYIEKESEALRTTHGSVTQQLVLEGRAAFRQYKLQTCRFLEVRSDVFLFPWCDARRAQTLTLMMRSEGLRASIANFTITVESASASDVKRVLKEISQSSARMEIDELAREARQISSDRFDRYLTPYYQRLAFARRFLLADPLDDVISELLAADVASVS